MARFVRKDPLGLVFADSGHPVGDFLACDECGKEVQSYYLHHTRDGRDLCDRCFEAAAAWRQAHQHA